MKAFKIDRMRWRACTWIIAAFARRSKQDESSRSNQAVGSLESRVMVSARKFEDLQVATSADGLPQLQQVEQTPRELQVAEFSQEPDEDSAAA